MYRQTFYLLPYLLNKFTLPEQYSFDIHKVKVTTKGGVGSKIPKILTTWFMDDPETSNKHSIRKLNKCRREINIYSVVVKTRMKWSNSAKLDFG